MSRFSKKFKGQDLTVFAFLIGLIYLSIVVYFGTLVPIGAVISNSMAPTIKRGDVVLVRSVPPSDLRVGDVVYVDIPRSFQETYSLPPNALHRIVDIEYDNERIEFKTQGDNNSNVDPIDATAENVGGRVVAHIPKVGFFFLYLNSSQGRLFLLIAGAALTAYFLYIWGAGTWQKAVGVATGTAGAAAAPVQPVPANPVQTIVPTADNPRLDRIESGVKDTQVALLRFSGAIAEYATHLQSHTAVVKGMSEASQTLAEIVQRQNDVLEKLSNTIEIVGRDRIQLPPPVEIVEAPRPAPGEVRRTAPRGHYGKGRPSSTPGHYHPIDPA
jgi:signal peptidase